MASVTIYTREPGKAHLTPVVEGTDAAILSDIVRTTAGTASLWTDAFTTDITIGSAGGNLQIDNDAIIGPSDGTGIVIGEAGTGASTGSTAQLASLTTGERDDLIEADGMLVYNESVPSFQGRVNGSWVSFGSTSLPVTQIAEATSTITRTLATYAVMSGMTITPGAGTYEVWMSTSALVDKNAHTVWISIFSNGAQVTASERRTGGQANNQGGITCQAKVTVTAGQAIDARWRLDNTGGGPTATAMARQLVLLKVA